MSRTQPSDWLVLANRCPILACNSIISSPANNRDINAL